MMRMASSRTFETQRSYGRRRTSEGYPRVGFVLSNRRKPGLRQSTKGRLHEAPSFSVALHFAAVVANALTVAL